MAVSGVAPGRRHNAETIAAPPPSTTIDATCAYRTANHSANETSCTGAPQRPRTRAPPISFPAVRPGARGDGAPSLVQQRAVVRAAERFLRRQLFDGRDAIASRTPVLPPGRDVARFENRLRVSRAEQEHVHSAPPRTVRAAGTPIS